MVSIKLIIIFLLVFVVILILALAYWLNSGGSDRLEHPEEYRTKGSAGERTVYLTLVKNFGVPENQILRNVYIPTDRGTTEIDMLIVSKKGILIFECKNYSGNIYGDGKKQKWIQYIGRQKNYFLSPVVQNRGHVKRVKEFFKDIEDLPVIPFIITTQNANWKLRNIDESDHVLGWTGQHFSEIYKSLPNSEVMAHNFKRIYSALKALERPDESVREAHVAQLKGFGGDGKKNG